VYSGFRMAPGGAQEYYGVKADMVVYGKVRPAILFLAAVDALLLYAAPNHWVCITSSD
jgi:hypothetical protein